jgi:hypothetical protein
MIIAVLLVSLLGEPCAFQRFVSVESNLPSEDELTENLKKQINLINRSVQPQKVKKFAQTFHLLLTKKIYTAKRLQNYEILLGVLLIAAYSLIFTLSIRSLRRSFSSFKLFSMACLFVLPVHTALGALDLAQSRQLSSAVESFIFSYLHDLSGIPEKDAQVMAYWGSLGGSSLQVVWTFGICIFFFYASRYFQREDVVAWGKQVPS